MSFLYHPTKASMVFDALSRMTMGGVSYVEEGKNDLLKYVHSLLVWVLDWKILKIVLL